MGSHAHMDRKVEAISMGDPHLTDVERSTGLPKRNISVFHYRHVLAFGGCPRVVESGQQAYEL